MIERSALLLFLHFTFVVVNNCLPMGGISGTNYVNKYRLPNETVPIHYNVRLNPQMSVDDNTFEGEVEVDFKVREATTNVVLHSARLIIDESATNIIKDGNTLKPKEHVYNEDTEMLRLSFEHPLQPGMYRLNMKFEGELSNNNRGFFKGYYYKQEKEVPILATHFQQIRARRAFPCWDEPALKATFNISMKCFNNYTALSNMPAYKMEHDETDGKDWIHFQTTPLMSTNILAFTISDFEHVSNPNGTVRIWASEDEISDMEFFMEVIEKATTALTEYLNNTVQVPKMDHFVLPMYPSRALESWGLIIYIMHAVPRNDLEYFDEKVRNTMTVIHELAHSWFGNLVSPSWWRYYWMSEGLATYMTSLFIDQIFSNWRSMDRMVIDQINCFSEDDHSDATAINQVIVDPRNRPRVIFVYKKPSSIFRMLSSMIGADIFRAGLLNYINAHEYSSVTSDDLWEAMQNAIDRSDTPHLGFNVKDVMDSWIEQPGYPLITVTQNRTSGDVIITQEPSVFGGDKTIRKWWVPINYATKSKPDFSTTKPMYFLKPDDNNVTIEGIDVDDWIIVNLQQTGYYRVNYDTANWRKIVDYLNTEDYKNIHVANRVQILDTALHLFLSKQLDLGTSMGLTNYLRRETDLVVWSYVFSQIVRIDNHIENPKGGALLKPFILGLMEGVLGTIDYGKSLTIGNNVSKLAVNEVLTFACKYGDPKCKEQATTYLHAYLEDPQANRIPPFAEYWVLCTGLANANESIRNPEFLQKVRESKVLKTSKYIGCVENWNILMDHLRISLLENATIQQYVDLDSILYPSNPMTADVVIDFLSENADAISSNMNKSKPVLEHFIKLMNSEDQLDKLNNVTHNIGVNVDSDIHYRRRFLHQIKEEVAEISSLLSLFTFSHAVHQYLKMFHYVVDVFR